mmetsp:Transcript_19138/g.41286  ORF Transcript_19138/g.41286 Transcript_19138/m.41286 type:complete len:324 (+) Transcript_19138:2188-3159(+)
MWWCPLMCFAGSPSTWPPLTPPDPVQGLSCAAWTSCCSRERLTSMPPPPSEPLLLLCSVLGCPPNVAQRSTSTAAPAAAHASVTKTPCWCWRMRVSSMPTDKTVREPTEAPRVRGTEGSRCVHRAAAPHVARMAGRKASSWAAIMPALIWMGEARVPLGCSRVEMNMDRHCSQAAENVAAVATWPWSADSRASGMSSANAIQIMQPAAKPSARGSSAENVSTNTYEGTATMAWGKEQSSVQYKALVGELPLDIITPATAMPSGTLCTPMAMVTSKPCAQPRCPLKDTPTPEPSPNACAAITPMISMALRASAPCRSSNDTSSN